MVGSSSYPRVLVVGQAFNRRGGGGITLSNLFEGWPPGRLAAAIGTGHVMEGDVCDRYYVLGSDESVWAWPLSLVRRRSTPPSGTDTGGPGDGRAEPGDSPSPAGRAAGLLYAGLDLLGVRDELRSLRMSSPLRAWIRGFAPDVVYSLLGDLPMMSLVGRIIDEFDCPLALHMMDDWPCALYRDGALQTIVRSHMERRLRSLIGRATSLLAISDAMAAEYETRYGRTFLPVHNPVDLERWDALAATYRVAPDRPPSECLRVVYTGRVGTGNTDSILDVAEVVSDMSSHGKRISLQVNTPDADASAATRMAACQGVVVTPGGEYRRVPGLMAAADVLLLPLDFDEQSVRLMRLSMPTKVSEYLASGRPVLTYAPRGSAAAEYARTHGWSLVVDERDPAAIRRALELLIDDDALRKEMGSRARQCAEESHDARHVRAQFRAALATGVARALSRTC
jgi:glycosyltransferase involved in cell wall biosynthesis